MKKSRHMSRARLGILSAVAMLVLAACGSTAPSEDAESSADGPAGSESTPASGEPTELTLLLYAGGVEENYTKDVVEPFNAANPDIHVTVEAAQSSAGVLASLQSHQADPQADIAMLDAGVAHDAYTAGLLQPLDPDQIPNISDVDPAAIPANNEGVGITFNFLSIVYNTKAVPEAPDKWSALWESGHKVTLDPAPNVRGAALIALIDALAGANYQDTIDPAVAALKQMAPNVVSWSPSPDVTTLVLSGEADMGVAWNGKGHSYKDESGDKLGVVMPENKTVSQVNTLNVVTGAEHVDAVNKFLDYALSGPAQAAFAKSLYYSPTNTTTKLDADLEAKVAPADLQIIPVDWAKLATHLDSWSQMWKQDIIAG